MNDKIDMNIAHWAAICENLNEEEQTDQRAILNTVSPTVKNMLSKIDDLNGALKSRLLLEVLGNLMKYFKEHAKEVKKLIKLADMCQEFYSDFYHEAFQVAKDQQL